MGVTWRVQRSPDRLTWTDVGTDSGGTTQYSFTPLQDERLQYLRFTATYFDGTSGSGRSGTGDQEAQVVSMTLVAYRMACYDHGVDYGVCFPPDLQTTYRVPENTKMGTVLTGSLRASNPHGLDVQYGSDLPGSFRINSIEQLVATNADFEAESRLTLSIIALIGETSTVADRLTLVVLVGNVDENAKVTLSTTTPFGGKAITATLTDPDGGETNLRWQWESREPSGSWSSIAGATAATYTPVAGDAGKHLRATVAYDDSFSPDKNARSAQTDVVRTPVVTLTLTPDTIAESGSGNVSTVTATLDKASTAPTAVTVTAAGSAVVLSPNSVLTIPAGMTASTGTVTLTAADDNVDNPEDKRTVTVSATATNTYGVTAPEDQVLTITDDDGAPTGITLTVAPDSVNENAGATQVNVSVAVEGGTAYGVDQTVSVSVVGGTATPTEDYALVASFAIVIPAGETSASGNFSFTPVSDNVDEEDETVRVEGATQEAAGPVTGTTVTITDDDAAPTGITLTVDPTSVGEAAAATTVTATVAGGTTYATAQEVTVAVGAAGDAATEGTDYATVADFDLTIAAGASSGEATFMLDPTHDTVDEGAGEAVSVSGTLSGVTVTGTTVTGTTVTITDDDGQPAVTLVLTPASIGENGGVSTVTARLNGASSETTTVTVSAAAVSPAVEGDFTLSTPPTLTIAAGATTSTGTVTITAVDNEVDAADKEVTVSCTVENTQGVADPGDQTLTITDDDVTREIPTVTLVLSSSEIGEDGGVSTVTATLNLVSSTRTTVTVSATPGADTKAGAFRQTGSTLTIVAGQTTSTGTVTIAAVDDNVDAPNKTVIISGIARNSQGVTGPAAKTLTIMDDDEISSEIQLDLLQEAVTEAGGPQGVTVTAAYGTEVTLPTATVVTIQVVEGTAIQDLDFKVEPPFELTIAAEETVGTGRFTLVPVDDEAVEEDETVRVSGSAPRFTVMGALLTIVDDERMQQERLTRLNRMVLPRVLQAMVASTVTAITDHMDAALARGGGLVYPGTAPEPGGRGAVTGRGNGTGDGVDEATAERQGL